MLVGEQDSRGCWAATPLSPAKSRRAVESRADRDHRGRERVGGGGRGCVGAEGVREMDPLGLLPWLSDPHDRRRGFGSAGRGEDGGGGVWIWEREESRAGDEWCAGESGWMWMGERVDVGSIRRGRLRFHRAGRSA